MYVTYGYFRFNLKNDIIMKKTLFFTTAAFAAISIASCSGPKKTDSEQGETRSELEVYSGILPAADTDGIKYTLRLNFSPDSDFKSGSYDLEESYLMVDTLSTDGFKCTGTDISNGTFSVFAGEGSDSGRHYLKLDNSSDTVAAPPVFFLIENDSTLTMVNQQLEPSVNPDLNYSLILQ